MRWLVVAVMFVSKTAATSCGNCNARCVDTTDISVAIDTSTLAGDTITECINGRCATGVLAAGSASAELEGAFSVDVVVQPTSLDLVLYGPCPCNDGDTYSVDVTTPDGVQILARSGSALHSRFAAARARWPS